MLKKTVYFCEYCGEVFEDYDSCNLHEMEEMAKRCEDSFKLYDKLGEVKLNLKLILHLLLLSCAMVIKKPLNCSSAISLASTIKPLLLLREKKPSWCSMNALVTGAILMKPFNSFKICSKQQ